MSVNKQNKILVEAKGSIRKSRPRYLSIVDTLAKAIECGKLQPGEKISPQRELGCQLGVAIGTVSRAYTEAARKGLIIAEVGRGTFVAAQSQIPQTAFPQWTNDEQIDLRLNSISSEEGHFALGDTLKLLSRRPDLGELLGCYPITGDPRHRAAGAKWIQRTGLSATPDHVVVCNGVQHGLAVILGALSTPGDVVVTEELNYPGVRLLERLYHLRLKGVPVDEYGIRPEALEAACVRDAPKFLLCTPTIHNPTTSVMPLERRKAIMEIAVKRNLTIVENGINGLLPREPALPLAAFAPKKSYYVTSFSKTIGGGVRLGYILGPDGSLEKLAVAVQATTWVSSPLIGEIVSMWIEDGTAEKFLEWHRREAETRQQLAKTILGHCEYESHPNGYHIWLRIPEPWREQEFVAEAGKRNVLLNPAEAFLIGRGAVPHAIRISLGGVKSRDVLSRGLRVISEILSRGPQPARVTI